MTKAVNFDVKDIENKEKTDSEKLDDFLNEAFVFPCDEDNHDVDNIDFDTFLNDSVKEAVQQAVEDAQTTFESEKQEAAKNVISDDADEEEEEYDEYDDTDDVLLNVETEQFIIPKDAYLPEEYEDAEFEVHELDEPVQEADDDLPYNTEDGLRILFDDVDEDTKDAIAHNDDDESKPESEESAEQESDENSEKPHLRTIVFIKKETASAKEKASKFWHNADKKKLAVASVILSSLVASLCILTLCNRDN